MLFIFIYPLSLYNTSTIFLVWEWVIIVHVEHLDSVSEEMRKSFFGYIYINSVANFMSCLMFELALQCKNLYTSYFQGHSGLCWFLFGFLLILLYLKIGVWLRLVLLLFWKLGEDIIVPLMANKNPHRCLRKYFIILIYKKFLHCTIIKQMI